MPGLNSKNLCHWSLLDVVSMLRTVPLSFMETFDIPGSLYEAVSIKGFSDRIFVSPDCSANMQLKDKQKIVMELKQLTEMFIEVNNIERESNNE